MSLTKAQKRFLNNRQKDQISGAISNMNSVSKNIPLYKIVSNRPVEPYNIYFDVQFTADKTFTSDQPWSFHFRTPYYLTANAGTYKYLLARLTSYNINATTGATEVPPFYVYSNLQGNDFNPYIAVLSAYTSDSAIGNTFKMETRGIENQIYVVKLYSDTQQKVPVTSSSLMIDIALRFQGQLVY
jgi:hypothetical protein